ncbi:hypothetical protein R50072_39140 [Simiduia litorea]
MRRKPVGQSTLALALACGKALALRLNWTKQTKTQDGFSMHKSDLIAAVAETADLTKDKADLVVSSILEQITNALSRDDVVSLVGFGSFSQRKRAARTGRSPKTGETIQIPASVSVGFKPGKGLKDAVNS